MSSEHDLAVFEKCLFTYEKHFEASVTRKQMYQIS